jgi:hypothetical protein
VLLALSVIAYFKIKVGVKFGVKTGILFKHLSGTIPQWR